MRHRCVAPSAEERIIAALMADGRVVASGVTEALLRQPWEALAEDQLAAVNVALDRLNLHSEAKLIFREVMR